MVAVALQVEHDIHDVLQHARPRNRAGLGHMPDDEDGHALRLGQVLQARGALANLADAARRGHQLFQVNRLDRVDDRRARLQFAQFLQDQVEVHLRQQVQVLGVDAQPVGAHLDLLRRLLARHIQHRPDRVGHHGRDFQEQGRLADAGVPADEHQRTGHDAAAQHAVEFLQRDAIARVAVDVDVAQRLRPRAEAAVDVQRARAAARLPDLLDQRIPLATLRALPGPARRLVAALLANIDRLYFFIAWHRWSVGAALVATLTLFFLVACELK